MSKADPTEDVTVIIPHLKKEFYTRRAIYEIREHEKKLRILVLVNDPEGFPIFPGANMLYTRERNLTRSWNLGITASRTKNIILLNNDIHCKGKFAADLSSLNETHISGTKLRNDIIAPGKYLEGWCLSFSKKTWEDVGKFDEDMELYCSDTYFQYIAVRSGIQLKKCKVPLRHLGHKTAHDPAITPDRVNRFSRDTRTLRKKVAEYAKR